MPLPTHLSPAGWQCAGIEHTLFQPPPKLHSVSLSTSRPAPSAVLYSNWPNKRQKQEFITPWAVLETDFIFQEQQLCLLAALYFDISFKYLEYIQSQIANHSISLLLPWFPRWPLMILHVNTVFGRIHRSASLESHDHHKSVKIA